MVCRIGSIVSLYSVFAYMKVCSETLNPTPYSNGSSAYIRQNCRNADAHSCFPHVPLPIYFGRTLCEFNVGPL